MSRHRVVRIAPRGRVSPSPARRWQRFRQQRLGYWSFVIFVVAFAASLAAPLWSNDKPLVVRYDGHTYFPMFQAIRRRPSAATSRRRPIISIRTCASASKRRATSRSTRRTAITTTR
jgi:hypothetical protein